MEPRDEVILRKALSEIDIAENRMGDHSLAEFNENEMLMRAICMTVINIGELVKTLSESFRRTHHDIPWKVIAGFRDIALTNINRSKWVMFMKLFRQTSLFFAFKPTQF